MNDSSANVGIDTSTMQESAFSVKRMKCELLTISNSDVIYDTRYKCTYYDMLLSLPIMRVTANWTQEIAVSLFTIYVYIIYTSKVLKPLFVFNHYLT